MMKMVKRLVKKWWQSHFGSTELLQLFLQQRDGSVSVADQKRMEKWAARDSLRVKAYYYFCALLPFKRQIADASGHDIRKVLQDITTKFPKPFAQINPAATEFTIRRALSASLDQAMYNMANLVVFGFKWLTVVILLVRLAIVVLAAVIIWALLHMYQKTTGISV
jgi:hypothetical protein